MLSTSVQTFNLTKFLEVQINQTLPQFHHVEVRLRFPAPRGPYFGAKTPPVMPPRWRENRRLRAWWGRLSLLPRVAVRDSKILVSSFFFSTVSFSSPLPFLFSLPMNRACMILKSIDRSILGFLSNPIFKKMMKGEKRGSNFVQFGCKHLGYHADPGVV